MPFQSSKIQSKLLSAGFDDEPPSAPLSTYFALHTTFLDLPSSFHSQSASPSSPSAARTSSSVTRYLPSRAAAWWGGEKASLARGQVGHSTSDGIEDHGEDVLEQRDSFHTERAMGVVEMIGLFLVIVALVGVVILCAGMNIGIGATIAGSGIRGKV